MPVRPTLLTLFTLSSCLVSAAASPLDGMWHITGTIQDNAVVSECVIAEKDGTLSGTCTGVDGKVVPIKGTVKEAVIKWQYDSEYQGQAITISYTAKADKEDHLVGDIYVEPFGAGGNFTAAKKKATTAPAPAAPPAS